MVICGTLRVYSCVEFVSENNKILDLAYMLHKRKKLWYKPEVDDRFIRAIRLKRFLSYHMRGKITEC